MPAMARGYRVFISHSAADAWLAKQIRLRIKALGADSFLDVNDIAKGDDFKSRIKQELPSCDELLALFCPWSRVRRWVSHEIGMADMLGKRIVCVFQGVTLRDFHEGEDGLGPLSDLNIVEINDLDSYFEELKRRIEMGSE
jgi:hypothetical protein